VELRFEKYEGLGNDFLVVDSEELARLPEGVVPSLCDRHRGVGADGVLAVGLENGRPFMRVTNADGTVPEMCGNGIRCVALHLVRAGRGVEVIDTDAGPHRVRVDGDWVEVWMRPASLEPRDLPLASDHTWIEEPIEIAGMMVRATAVSMGNPHAVLFEEDEHKEILGPALERETRYFPERVNVGFAKRTADGLDLHVFERGVGWTMACGTGACAAAVAAVESGRAERDRDLLVRLPGGPLVIRVGARGEPIRMTGPARHVFSGAIRI
jgi:diaminopimelate epimerase